MQFTFFIITINQSNNEFYVNNSIDTKLGMCVSFFTIMGMYPVAPGSNTYALGIPMFSKITINLKNPLPVKSFTIIARNLSDENRFVQSVKLNDKPLPDPFITHEQIMENDSLVFVMGP